MTKAPIKTLHETQYEEAAALRTEPSKSILNGPDRPLNHERLPGEYSSAYSNVHQSHPSFRAVASPISPWAFPLSGGSWAPQWEIGWDDLSADSWVASSSAPSLEISSASSWALPWGAPWWEPGSPIRRPCPP
eukprot:CAMPEP_0184410494 /NCGR_PEP_ID=MMETSP0738-20130409/4932_1 /TAXON_ID=385413 /ORGANISM="Thalassiosira miniscula, Strain CCMP1093" /LENGTH=132 /DNA_ID=CAMNT_0026768509 /DNA_START=82 /DNA_END=477 /DNA_ORIENTATION=-